MAWICGVEEAGRGPVIGPMAMASCWTEDEELLRKVGCKDSKQLTPQQREEVFERLESLKEKGTIGFSVILLSPAEIDAAVEGEHDNLNKLEQRTTATLITAALKDEKVTTAYIDCPTTNTKKYADELARILKEDVELIAENKADERYPVVGAASIIAKVTRDREIEQLKRKLNANLGSGYPADPLTQQFLRENYRKKELRSIFRTSWASYKNLAGAAGQATLGAFAGFEKPKTPKLERDMKIMYDKLLAHGFSYAEPKTQYELVRMNGPDATVIKYTTGKLLVQGKKKAETETILKRLGAS